MHRFKFEIIARNYPIWHPLNIDRFSMAVQHSSHANPCCCWSATFFNMGFDF